MRIGLIGNPNVGKSTIFNGLTGMRQHTGNWPGKTVARATGFRIYDGVKYQFEDLPGTYSLFAHSKEEEVTRDFVYFEDYDALLVVCDATALERNLNLVLQVLEITNKVVVAGNKVNDDVFNTKKVIIAKLAVSFCEFNFCNSSIVFKPQGVAAFPKPSKFAAIFIPIGPKALLFLGTLGNKKCNMGRIHPAKI